MRLNKDTGGSTIRISQDLNKIKEISSIPYTFTITDKNVFNHYSQYISDSWLGVIEPGEQHKTLKTVEKLYNLMVENGVDRKCRVVGIGGGVVTDISGYTASTYMRGIPFGFISTSLLGSIDASVGGKNGVNLKGYKNMIGLFRQPEFVNCLIPSFKTLPSEEIKNGLGEAIKHGAIASPSYLEFINENIEDILMLKEDKIEKLVKKSIAIKSSIVSEDEHEKSWRKVLNFGHTTGHALEKLSQIPHGYGVAYGMVIAAKISCKIGILDPSEYQYLVSTIEKAGLPVELNLNIEALTREISKDKKKKGEKIDFILLESLGKPVIKEICIKELRSIICDL